MSTFTPSRLLIFGATGQIGAYITKSLLRASPPFEHITIFTSKGSSPVLTSFQAPNTSFIKGDVTNLSDVSSAYNTSRPDTVISALGRDAIQHQIDLIRLAEEDEGIKWFFPSEYGTDIEHNEKSPNEKPHQQKLKVRKFIRESVKRLKITYLVTGPYFDMWVNHIKGARAAGGFDLENKEATLIEDGEGKIGFCTMWDVGKFLVASLRHPEESYGKALKVQSFVVTPKEVLAEYEKQTGAKWKVTYTPLQELKELEAKLHQEGAPFATGPTLRRIWAEGGTLYAKNDNDVISLKDGDLESLETGVRRAISGNKDA